MQPGFDCPLLALLMYGNLELCHIVGFMQAMAEADPLSQLPAWMKDIGFIEISSFASISSPSCCLAKGRSCICFSVLLRHFPFRPTVDFSCWHPVKHGSHPKTEVTLTILLFGADGKR